MLPKAVIMLSGGLDSAVAMADARSRYGALQAILFDYGQASGESQIASARRLCAHYDVPLEIVDVSGLSRNFAGLTDDITMISGVTEHACNCPHALFGLASTFAVLVKADRLVVGVNQDDVRDLGDAGAYFANYGSTLSALQDVEFAFDCPLLDKSKASVVSEARTAGVPMELTWSCREGQRRHCGTCPECKQRRAAFADAGIEDPTEYVV